MKFRTLKDGMVIKTNDAVFLIRDGIFEPIHTGGHIKVGDVVVMDAGASVIILMENGTQLNYDRETLTAGGASISYQQDEGMASVEDEAGAELQIKTVIDILEDDEDTSGDVYHKTQFTNLVLDTGFNFVNLDRIHEALSPAGTFQDTDGRIQRDDFSHQLNPLVTQIGALTTTPTFFVTNVTTSDSRVNEGQSISFAVTLNRTLTTFARFAYRVGMGTAVEGEDFSSTQQFSDGVTLNTSGDEIIVPPGISNFTVTIHTLYDMLLEPVPDETLWLQVGSQAGASAIIDHNITLRVHSIVQQSLGIGNDSVSEGQSLVFRVALNTALGTPVVMDFNLGGGTAGNADYTMPPIFSDGVILSADRLSITIPAGINWFTVTVPTVNDGLYEPGSNETLPITIDGLTVAGEIIDVNTIPVVTSIESNVAGTSDSLVLEGQSMVFNVALSNLSAVPTTLSYSLGNGTANTGADYTAPPTFTNGVTLSADGLSVIVPAGVNSFSVTVPTIDDGIAEPGGNETLQLAIGGVIAHGDIVDVNGSPSVASIEAGNAGTSDDAVQEGQDLVFTITLSNASGSPTNFAWSLVGGTASSGIDYSVPPTFSNGVTLNPNGVSLDIPAGVSSFTVTIPTLNDGIYEPGSNETVALTVDGVTATGSIIDINTPPAVTSIEPGLTGNSDDAVTEGQNLVYTVTLSGTSSTSLSYAYNLGGGTATGGSDYTSSPSFSNGVTLSVDGLTIIVPAGVSSFTVTVPTLNDGIYEPGASETVPLSIGGMTASGGIIDANSAPTVTSLEVGAPGAGDDAVNEGQSLVFNVTLSNASTIPTTLAYVLGGGSATSNVDYSVPATFSNGVTLSSDGASLIVPAGITSFSVTVSTLNDGVYEPGADETVPITIGAVSATGNIADINTSPAVSSIQIDAAGSNSDTVSEGSNLVYTITLSNASTSATTLVYSLGGGSASSGLDYTDPPSFSNGVILNAGGTTLNIPAGVTSFTITVPTVSDNLYEPGGNETVPLSVGGVSSTGQIIDLNIPPAVTSIEPGLTGNSDDAVTEGQNLVYTVTLSGTSSTSLSYAYNLGGGTATGGSDYTSSPSFSNGVTLSVDGLTIIVPAGVSSFTVTVPTLNDGIYEPGASETVPLSIGGMTASGGIIDANSAPTVTSLEVGASGIGDDAVNEGQSLVYTVSLSNASSTATTLAYSAGGGTATSGTDYTVPPTFSNGVTLNSGGTTLNIPAGVTSFTITVPTVSDNLYEPGGNETVPLSVGGVSSTGQIIDLNTVPTVSSVEPGLPGSSDDAVSEGQNLVFNVSLSNPSTVATTLAYTLGGGTATSGIDYSVPPTFSNGVTLNTGGTTLNIPAGVTSFSITVPTIADNVSESTDETVPISVGGVGSTGFITDGNVAPVVMSIESGATGSGDDAVTEGQSLVYTVTLSGTSSTSLSYAYNLGGGTATGGSDYTSSPSFSNGVTLSVDGLTIIVPAGVSSFTVTVPTLNDGIYEPGASETVPLSIGGMTASGGIIDANSAPTVTSLEVGASGIGDDAVNEGQSLVYTVSLSNASSTATTLAYSAGGGTATSGTDYTVPPTFGNGVTLNSGGTTLNIPAGVTSFTITVPTVSDNLYEPGGNETVPLSVGGVSSTGQIIDLNTVPTVSSVEPGLPGSSDDAVSEGQNLVFNVSLSNPSTVATTLAYTLGGGTATSGIDYSVPPTFSNGVTLNPGGTTLNIPAGVTSFSITVPTLNDGIYEPGANETVPLSVGGITGTGQIMDVDTSPTISSMEVGNPGTADDSALEGRSMTYRANMNHASASPTLFSYVLGGGTAISGIDYNAIPTFSDGVTLSSNGLNLIVPAGVTSFTITIVTINDGIREASGNQTLPLRIGGVTATGQIIDNSFYVSEEGLQGANPDTSGTPTDYTNATSVNTFIGINSISTLLLTGVVTSSGNLLNINPVLQGDGSYSFGYNSGGNFIQVANFKLDGSGNMVFTLLKPLDHPVAGAEDTLSFPVRLNGVDLGLYVEDDSPFIANTFNQQLAPTTSENVAPVVNNPNSPNLLGLASVGLPSAVVSADILSAASATISLTDYTAQQSFTAYDANNNLQKIVIQYNALASIGLPAYTLTYSADMANAFGFQIRTLNAQGALVNIAQATSLEITSLDGGTVDNLAINQFLNTVHFNTSGLLTLGVLNATTITATDAMGLSSSSAVASLLSPNLLNPAFYTTIQGGVGNSTLTGTIGNDQIYGGSGNESLNGQVGNDVIFGNSGNDQIDGGVGNDLLMGGIGNDTMTGGTGNDLLYGGAGNDRLTGGAGNDFFIFNLADKGSLGTPAVDTITDFSKTEDYLDLRNLLQGENAATIQRFLFIETVAGNTILHISTNGGFESGYTPTQENQTIVLNGIFTQTEIMSRLLYDASALSGSLPGSYGDDGGYVSVVTIENTSFVYNAVSNIVTSNSALPVDYDADTHILAITTSLGEEILINVLNSHYSYLDTSALHKGQYSTLNYTLSDNDGDTSSARLEFAGQQAYADAAPQTDLQVSGGLLGLISVSGVQTSPGNDLIDLKAQQIFSAYDVNNNLQTVEIKYSGVLGLLGTYSVHASTAMADQLGLHVNVVDTAAVSLFGTPILAPTSTLTITANDGGTISNLAINELLGTITFTHSGLLNDLLSAQLLSATTIKATDSTGLSSSSTTGSLLDISLLTATQTTTIATEGTAANDTMTGTTGNDRIYGYAGNDTLNGGNGNDLLHGGSGNDTIHGGSGNDIVIGGAGSDLLYGEAGADVFRWELNNQGTIATPAADIITDFTTASYSAGGDVLDLRDLLVGEAHLGTDTGNLANYLHFSVSGGDTTVKINTTGDVAHSFNQMITLQGVDIVSGFANDQQVIANLLTNQKLVVD